MTPFHDDPEILFKLREFITYSQKKEAIEYLKKSIGELDELISSTEDRREKSRYEILVKTIDLIIKPKQREQTYKDVRDQIYTDVLYIISLIEGKSFTSVFEDFGFITSKNLKKPSENDRVFTVLRFCYLMQNPRIFANLTLAHHGIGTAFQKYKLATIVHYYLKEDLFDDQYSAAIKFVKDFEKRSKVKVPKSIEEFKALLKDKSSREDYKHECNVDELLKNLNYFDSLIQEHLNPSN